MNVVDFVVIGLVVLAAIQGLRLGAIVQVLSYGGFVCGLVLGALLASVTVRQVHTTSARTTVALVTMLGVATLLGVAGRIVGNLAFLRVHRGRLGVIDSVLGVVVAVVSSLLVVWLLASTLVNSSSLSLNTAIDQSSIIRSLDNVLPPSPRSSRGCRASCPRRGSRPSSPDWPRRRPVRCPCPGTPSCRRRSLTPDASTVKIIGDGCGEIQEGSGFVVAPGLVVTNAHVVAGIPHPMVVDGNGAHQTTVVLFDPSFDLAVMRVGGINEPPLALDPDPGPPGGSQAAVLGYPGGGPFTVVPAGVMADFEAEGRDIYGQGLTVRNVYEIQAIVRPGNSGGPLVEPDGQVIGVVFSRSTTNGDIGYALASPGVLSRVVQAESKSQPGGHRAVHLGLSRSGGAGTGREKTRAIGAAPPTRHGGHGPSHRGLRHHRRPPHRGPGRTGRLDRLAVPAPLRLGGVLRQAAGRRGPRLVEAGAEGGTPGHPPPLPGGHAGPRVGVRDRRGHGPGGRLHAHPPDSIPRWCGWSRVCGAR